MPSEGSWLFQSPEHHWAFNAQAIDRLQVETLATGEFIHRGDSLVIAGQGGVGKSRIVQSVG